MGYAHRPTLRALVIAAAAMPSAALAQQGVAPLMVPDGHGRLHRSASGHVSFPLPAGRWKRTTSQQGHIQDGGYVRTTVVNGKQCTVNVTAVGRERARRPALTLMPGSDHVRRGDSNGVEWLSAWDELPPSPPEPYAKAYRQSPAWAARAWTSFEVESGLAEPASSACRTTLRKLMLAAAARSFRIRHGAIH
jgi:hypothetical protein